MTLSDGNVEYDVIRHSGKPVVWKTGHSLMKKKMREDNIILGGEFSGHMFVSEKYYPVDDALYAATRVLDYLSRQDKPLSEQFSDFAKNSIRLLLSRLVLMRIKNLRKSN